MCLLQEDKTMPLTPLIRRTLHKTSTGRGPTPLAKVKAHYSSAQQQATTQRQALIQQLSQDQARITRAIPNSNDPVKTGLQRRSNLVSNRIGWLQNQTNKK